MNINGLPVIQTDELYHLGTLNRADRVRSSSLEGDCLSASLCPDSWEMVAQLGGSPTLVLSREKSLYLDFCAMSDEQRNTIIEEAVTAGEMEPAPWFRVWMFDGEADDWRTMSFWDEEQAWENADEDDLEMAECPTESGELVERVEGHRLTAIGESRVGRRFPTDAIFSEDAAALLWTMRSREMMPDLCGVFWDENDDPAIMSAPRYAILPDVLPELTVLGPLGKMSFDDYAAAASCRDNEPEM